MTLFDRSKWMGILIIWCVSIVLNGIVMPYRLSPSVPIETVQDKPLSLVVRAPGHLDAKSTVTIKAEFDGAVISKQFHEGQQVQAGQLLALLDTSKIRLEHQEKQDALTNAKSEIYRARKEVQLQKSLYSKQAVAYSSVEEAQSHLTKMAQALRSAEEAWRLEQGRWKSAQVISPIKGTVVKDGIGEDSSVSSNKEIVTVADMTDFFVKARVDELDIKRVAEKQLAEVRLQIYPNNVFSARVTQIGSQPDGPDSTAIPIVLTLVDSQRVLLRPKLSADVRIIMGQTPPLLSIPLTAIHNADGKTKVWVLDLWGRLRAREVTLGQSNPERGEITTGLKRGSRICVTATPDLAEGMRVMPRAANGPDSRKSPREVFERLAVMLRNGKSK